MRLYGEWQVSLPDGESYKWLPDDVIPDEERVILAESGFDSYDEWVGKVDEREATACQVLIWFLRRKNGKPTEGRGNVVIPHRRIDTERLDVPAGDGQGEASAGTSSALPPTSEPAS